MITLITMGAGNPIALKRTIDSFPECDEVIFGDVLLFEEDRRLIATYDKVKMVKYDFDYIFKNGFATILNNLADHAKNDWCIYMNVSEVRGEWNDNVNIAGSDNCYQFNHATDPHHWKRLYNRKELRWSGLIHEELVGNIRCSNTDIFTMADTDKDTDNEFKSQVLNDVKELVYFQQYLNLIDKPNLIGATNQGWVAYARENYQHIKDRLIAKGGRYSAMEFNDLDQYMRYAQQEQSFNFEDSKLIHFQ